MFIRALQPYDCSQSRTRFTAQQEKVTMARSRNHVDRRRFLKGAAVGAAAFVSQPATGTAQQQPAPAARATTPLPSPALVAAETSPPPPRVDVYTTDRPGSDFMVDVIKSLGIEYVAANPGSTFRALHESIINYGGNKSPSCSPAATKSRLSAMAHGYAKIEGKPIMVMAHGTVGLQHASMAIYNAYADRVPVYIVIGNVADGPWRRSDVEWTHAVQDAALMVRDYTKWDDSPISLTQFAESAVRAYKIAMTPPMGPTVLVADAVLQEEPVSPEDRGRLRVPKLSVTSPPAGDSGAVAEIAKLLVAAENPLIVTGRSARTPKGLEAAGRAGGAASGARVRSSDADELSHAPSAVRHRQSRRRRRRARARGAGSVPCNAHAQTPVNRMGMESRPLTKDGAKLITISSMDLLTKSNYQDMGQYNEVDLAIAADAEATLPSLIESCKKLITPGSQARLRRARPEVRRTPPRECTIRRCRRPHGVGTPARSRRRECRLRSGIWSRTTTGRSCRRSCSRAGGRRGCGISRSTISSSAATAPTASATVRLRLSARRSPTGSTVD